jgi:peptide deformylase
MALLPIVRLGHPALRRRSTTVTKDELTAAAFQQFLDDLVETCQQANGAGIAAPQVGVNKRVIVVNVAPTNPRYPGRGRFPTTIVVNPRLTNRSWATEEDWEGDLSADIRGLVPRARTCTVSGVDRQGQPVRYELSGFPARVFQHEIDHLDGIFLIDRVKRRESLSETAEWERQFAAASSTR